MNKEPQTFDEAYEKLFKYIEESSRMDETDKELVKDMLQDIDRQKQYLVQNLNERIEELKREVSDLADDKRRAEDNLESSEYEVMGLKEKIELVELNEDFGEKVSLIPKNLNEELRNKAFLNIARNCTLEQVEKLEMVAGIMVREEGRQFITY